MNYIPSKARFGCLMIFRFLLQETNVFLAALSRARVLASPLEMPKMVQTARKVHQTSAFWDSVRYDANTHTISSDTFFLLIRKILSLTFRCFARFLVDSLLLSASWKISVQLGGSLSCNFYHLRNLNGKGTQEVSHQQTNTAPVSLQKKENVTTALFLAKSIVCFWFSGLFSVSL